MPKDTSYKEESRLARQQQTLQSLGLPSTRSKEPGPPPKSAVTKLAASAAAFTGPGEFGRATLPDGTTVSLRLNPDLIPAAIAEMDISNMLADDEFPDIQKIVDETEKTLELAPDPPEEGGMDMSGGRKRQRGGALEDWEKLQYAKAIAMMFFYKSSDVAKAAGVPVKDYFVSRFITPLYGTTSRTAQIMMGLADQIFQGGVTVANLSIAGVGFTANFTSKILENFNTWGGAIVTKALSDEYAKAAADAAVESASQVAVTAGVGLFVANQIGILPMSAVLAAILFALKVNLGTGTGRAYVVSSFYAWYMAQNKDDKKKIIKHAQEYATTAGKGAADAAVAAGKLGSLLSKKALKEPVAGEGVPVPGKDAVAVKDKDAVAVIKEAAAPSGSPPPPPSTATEILTAGASKASEAVVIASKAKKDGAWEPVPKKRTGGKTKKRSPKKARATRRRKAPKYLAAPVFGRKGITFAY